MIGSEPQAIETGGTPSSFEESMGNRTMWQCFGPEAADLMRARARPSKRTPRRTQEEVSEKRPAMA